MRRLRGDIYLLVGLSMATALQVPHQPPWILMRRGICPGMLQLPRATLLHPSSLFSRVCVCMSSEDLSALTVVQLKQRLRAAGLPVSGRKAELVDRLSADSSAAPAAAPAMDAAFGYPHISIEACHS